VEFSCLIQKEFKIQNLNLHYFVGINQIRLEFQEFLDIVDNENSDRVLDFFFKKIDKIQIKYSNSVIQFFKDKYLLNQDHVFTACYYLEKAFLQNINVSKKKNIELLLYLATNRQISNSIKDFGIGINDLSKSIITYCIITPLNNVDKIHDDLFRTLKLKQVQFKLNDIDNSKIKRIKEYFEISDNQLNSVLTSYGIKPLKSIPSLDSQVIALYDLICEKMALLHIEKTRVIP
jgi:tRNA threonylcarbamoyladenosine modification (KEOPS) complex Cgi121 subunit